MTTEQNRRLVLAKRPTGLVDHSTVRLETVMAPAPAEGEALVKVKYLSIDPTIRTWMNDADGYLPPIGIGEVIRSGGIGEVVHSNSDRYRKGDLVSGMVGWQEYALAGGSAAAMQTLPDGIDPMAAINVFGITGMTAYFGLLDVGRMKEGDVVVVSGAAGATGSSVGQIARAKGAGKVIGIAGGPDKCAYVVEELGFDAAIDYKAGSVGRRLREEAPKGIDLYFDNVGGEILDAVLGNLAMRGRVVLCGAIASYNEAGPPPGPSNYINLLLRRGRMEGFIILDYTKRFAEAQSELLTWMLNGQLKHTEHVVEGLERAPEALNLLFTGGNTGKVVVRV
ncbi:MAG: NADP-dependent oxidoreductase [Acidimicrobiales bacterium]